MKRILITGAAGFLGSHLCDRFIKEGYFVIGMDNLITGDLKNIEHLFKLQNFEFYHHDITKFVHVPDKLDYILHFASPASPIDYLKIPIQTLKVGSLGTHNLLGLARVKKARILIASTSEVYGDPLVHPQTEEYYGNVNTIGPRGVYDEAKRFMESITMAYHTFHQVETRIIRIFNTYGPRMRLNDGRVLPNLIGQAIRGEPMTVYGDGSQTRSFCHVDDLVEGISRLLFVDDSQLQINKGDALNGAYVYGLCEYNSADETYEYNVGFPLLSTGNYRLSFGYNSDSTKNVELRSLNKPKDIKLNLNSAVANLDNSGYFYFNVN